MNDKKLEKKIESKILFKTITTNDINSQTVKIHNNNAQTHNTCIHTEHQNKQYAIKTDKINQMK